jgi:epoxyqueuosine reductase
VLDATRCLSYWTIEQRGAIPDDIVPRMGGWVFGCDVCQEVCPYNAAIETEASTRRPPGLSEILDLRSSEWRRRYGDTPMSRAGLAGMKRNAAAAAESLSRREMVPRLRELAGSPNPVVAAQSAAAVARLSSARP